MLRVLFLLLLLLLLRQVFTSSQSQICLSVKFGSVHFFNPGTKQVICSKMIRLNIPQIKQWTNPNFTDKQIWLWDEVKTWHRSSSSRSRSSTLNILCTDYPNNRTSSCQVNTIEARNLKCHMQLKNYHNKLS